MVVKRFCASEQATLIQDQLPSRSSSYRARSRRGHRNDNPPLPSQSYSNFRVGEIPTRFSCSAQEWGSARNPTIAAQTADTAVVETIVVPYLPLSQHSDGRRSSLRKS